MTWLVTGGAGYIGAHIAAALLDAGLDVVVLDDLSTGRGEFVPAGAAFVPGDVRNAETVRAALVTHDVTGVIHAAGMKYAGVSVAEPLHAYGLNVGGTLSLLEAMADAGVESLVFSSSCSVYGTPTVDAVDETTPLAPESPYARSKLAAEWAIADAARARTLAGGVLRHVSLRYFNVVGAGGSPGAVSAGVWDSSPHNLFPLVFEALREGRNPRINGDDYPTPDGTCIRDYIHVADIADAHVAAALALTGGSGGSLGSGGSVPEVVNLGSGTGSSVREIMHAVADVTGIAFEPEVAPRRAGDPARIVAGSGLAGTALGWSARRGLREM
ncbi:MAG TPA: UDP-glucose 4-epimerase GalE, partial [Microbacteriaceae bacterium]|nr:UDP-glucose 4-epimerase GalE [Microbacteriaceae bacterium]